MPAVLFVAQAVGVAVWFIYRLCMNSTDVCWMCFGSAHINSSAGRTVKVAALSTDRAAIGELPATLLWQVNGVKKKKYQYREIIGMNSK